MAGGADSSGPVDIQANVLVHGTMLHAGMQPHPDPHRCTHRPWVGQDRLLRVDRRGERVSRTGESDEERITMSTDLMPARLLNGRAEQPSIGGKDALVAVPQVLKKTRGPFDIAEEEGDRPGR